MRGGWTQPQRAQEAACSQIDSPSVGGRREEKGRAASTTPVLVLLELSRAEG